MQIPLCFDLLAVAVLLYAVYYATKNDEEAFMPTTTVLLKYIPLHYTTSALRYQFGAYQCFIQHITLVQGQDHDRFAYLQFDTVKHAIQCMKQFGTQHAWEFEYVDSIIS